jgi:hypothetical protein
MIMGDARNANRCSGQLGQHLWVERDQDAMQRLHNLAALCVAAEHGDGDAFAFTEPSKGRRQRHRGIWRWGKGRCLWLGVPLRRGLLVTGLSRRHRRWRNPARIARWR